MRARKFLVRLDDLVPHEGTEYLRVKRLVRSIQELRAVLKPVIIDSRTKLIIDGHHRVAALKVLGAKYVPAIVIDYRTEIERIEPFTYVLAGSSDRVDKLAKSIVSEVDGSGHLPVALSVRRRGIGELLSVRADLNYVLEYVTNIASKHKLRYIKVAPVGNSMLAELLPRDGGGIALLVIKPRLITHDTVFETLRRGAEFPPRTTYHVTSLKQVRAPVKLEYLLKP